MEVRKLVLKFPLFPENERKFGRLVFSSLSGSYSCLKLARIQVSPE